MLPNSTKSERRKLSRRIQPVLAGIGRSWLNILSMLGVDICTLRAQNGTVVFEDPEFQFVVVFAKFRIFQQRVAFGPTCLVIDFPGAWKVEDQTFRAKTCTLGGHPGFSVISQKPFQREPVRQNMQPVDRPQNKNTGKHIVLGNGRVAPQRRGHFSGCVSSSSSGTFGQLHCVAQSFRSNYPFALGSPTVRSQSGRCWSNPDPNFVEGAPKFGRHRPRLAKLGLLWVELDQLCPNSAQTSVEVGPRIPSRTPRCAKLGPKFDGQTWPTLARTRSKSAKFDGVGQNRNNIDRIRPNLVQHLRVAPILVRFGPILAELRSTLFDIGSDWSNSGQRLPMSGRHSIGGSHGGWRPDPASRTAQELRARLRLRPHSLDTSGA